MAAAAVRREVPSALAAAPVVVAAAAAIVVTGSVVPSAAAAVAAADNEACEAAKSDKRDNGKQHATHVHVCTCTYTRIHAHMHTRMHARTHPRTQETMRVVATVRSAAMRCRTLLRRHRRWSMMLRPHCLPKLLSGSAADAARYSCSCRSLVLPASTTATLYSRNPVFL